MRLTRRSLFGKIGQAALVAPLATVGLLYGPEGAQAAPEAPQTALGGTVAGSMGHGELTSDAVRKAVRTLRRENVPVNPDGFYHLAIHPAQAYLLQHDVMWQDAMTYDSSLPGEIGRIHGVRLFSDT